VLRNRLRLPLAGLLLVAIAAAVLAAACGGGGGSAGATSAGGGATTSNEVPVSSWVGSLCSSVGTWQKTLTQGVPTISDPTDLAGTKKAFSDYLGKVVSATEQLISDVKAAGIPATENGKEIASAFTSTLSSLSAAFTKAKSDVEALSTSDPVALASGLQKVGSDLTTAGSQLGNTFDEIANKFPSADLGQAASKDPSCSALGAG
jgi:hypothetical protein